MEIWQIAVALIPVVLAAMARDRSMMTMISGTRNDWQNSIAAAKEDCRKMLDAGTGTLHDRISRVRDEYVRRDDLDGHLQRMEKQFDEVRNEMRRNSENTDKKLDDIRKLLQSS